MLAAGMLAHALRGARQRALGLRALAAATAAWRLLQPDECGVGSGSMSTSDSINVCSGIASSFALCSFFSNSSSSSSPARRGRGKWSMTEEPQPQLQAWLQEQGVPDTPEDGADHYARRLAVPFKSQQAALNGLPATFQWCRSRGLTGLQTAQVLDRIARKRRDNVPQFAATAQRDWQLMDSYIAARVQAVGDSKRLKHTSLAEKLFSDQTAALALVMPPGHVTAWLAAVSERLPTPAIGRLLLGTPNVVCGSPDKARAAIAWAADELGVADPAAFFGLAPSLLTYDAAMLQRNLDSLQQALGLMAEPLVQKQPQTLISHPDTVRAALAWLQQHFSAPEQLADVISRGSHLLTKPAQHLQGNADALQRALGWQDGDGQLAAFIAAYSQPFAIVRFSGEGFEHKLRFLTQVVGIDPGDCIKTGSRYLMTALEKMAAVYMLVQERAPQLLYGRSGGMSLSWIINANKPINLARLGMTGREFNGFVRDWPRREEGRRLLEGLRTGSVEGWPRPPAPEK